MKAEQILLHLRRFLLAFSGFILLGTLVELILIGHTKELIQWAPLVLSVTGCAAILTALFYPQQNTLVFLRGWMALLIAGSLVGIWEHVEKNLAFALEVHPNLGFLQQVHAALSGANPLIAPGVLAIAAILSVAATYQHPLLNRR